MKATLRAGRDADAAGFIALIGACWTEYPGIVLDIDGEVPELRALASYYAKKGGALWAAQAAGQMVGMVAAWPGDGGAWEVGRMYVAAAERGSGLAHRLLDVAEAHAAASGAVRLELWSDTRFDRAHRFYEKRSYIRHGAIRPLDDISHSIEFHYEKPLGECAVAVLDAAGAASAVPRLAAILAACVEAGASVSYLPPLAPAIAQAAMWRAARGVATGEHRVLAAWSRGVLAGTVQLALATQPNQPHRAEVQKLLVHPDARRRGLARALLSAAEQVARAAGRTLLTLDTNAGSEAEQLYRTAGWTEAGRIPGFSLGADGTLTPTVIFYRQL
ncbi:MAG TPA: GNAT family N-acetyltransferase [Acetobacteraceae bacterium]|nr:GNAT family N-acetyltransferase [Acetobacteraceae bacterium]